MSDSPLADQRARDLIRTGLDQTLMVEAGAGSGKTTSLVDRTVALLSEGRTRAENVAAITFTRKATAQLRERFQAALESRLGKEKDSPTRDRLRRALWESDRLFIGTTHAFCARLLRERPVEAGLPPDFSELDEMGESSLQGRAWDQYVLHVRTREPELLERLDRLDLSPEDLKGAFARLAEHPDVEMKPRPVPRPDFTPAREKVLDYALRMRAHLPDPPQEDGLQNLVRSILRRGRRMNLDTDREMARLLRRINRKPTTVLKNWASRDGGRQARDEFQRLREEVIVPTLTRWWEHRYGILMESFLPGAVSHYSRLRREEGLLTYADLLMGAAGLLRDFPEVRSYFQSRYTHLLVDEFQDTDPVQAEIMLYLAGDDPEETDWTRLRPRPGSLFVVGDPKQSIYRFRRADIDVYTLVRDIIQDAGGQLVHLTTNFRSRPRLISWANGTFEDLFDRQRPPYQAGFVPMDPTREEAQGAPPAVMRLEIPAPERVTRARVAAEEARLLARWIRWCLEGNLCLQSGGQERAARPEDFLLLTRTKLYLGTYARALEALDIPYSLTGASEAAALEEFRELMNVLRALADPLNPVPLVAALRGAFFGLSDKDLYRYRRSGGRFYFLEPVPPAVEDDLREVFSSFWVQLARYRDWARALSPSVCLEKILSDLGAVPLALSGEMSQTRVDHLLWGLELVRERERAGDVSFSRAVDLLEEALTGGLEGSDLDGAEGGVRVMNLHKAKGLEAPVVMLADPLSGSGPPPSLHVKRSGGRARGYLVLDRPKGPYYMEVLAQPPDWSRHQKEEERYQEAEETRLLYVAATRAENLLVVGSLPGREDRGAWKDLAPHLADRPALGPEDLTEESGREVFGPDPVTPARLERARAAMRKDRARLACPSYTRQSPAEIPGSGPPPRQAGGAGPSWGRVVHRALEAMVRQKAGELERLVGALLEKEGRDRAETSRVLAVLREVEATSLWSRVRGARAAVAEVPFGYWEEAGRQYVTGTVDLAFREPGGWVLVDFKSDEIAGPDHLEDLARYYSPQVRAYRRAWERVLGEPVKEAGLFFTSVLRFVEIGPR